MMHVKQITEIIDAGATDQAHVALEQLLALGPNNTAALKLQARLFEYEGRFVDESRVWDRIATIDREDPDAIAYLLRRQTEDREHFYFTDDLPGGGRRFVAYPRSLVLFSAIGLIGCLSFLLTTRLSGAYPILAVPQVMLSSFGVLVMLPWLAILTVYCRSIRSVIVSPTGITVATRLRTHAFNWPDLERVCLAQSSRNNAPCLSLLLVPKNPAMRPVEIDLTQHTTAIRARSYLVRDITRFFNEPEHLKKESLGLGKRRLARF
jgi:hypothetical protein